MEKIKDFLKGYDFSLILAMIVISIFGILNIYSSTHASSNLRLVNIYKSQILWVSVATVVAFIVSAFKPRFIAKMAYPAYFFNLFLLVLVLVLGEKGMGAQRWLVLGPFRLQPSELMKISLVLAVSKWIVTHKAESSLGLKDLLMPGILVMFPMAFIIKQPDLGTSLILLIVTSIMFFYKRLRWKSIFILIITGLIGGGVVYKFGLKEYQKKRILTFIDPYSDAKGAGYNAIQSAIAIGSGKMTGKGYMKSTQASLAFLPENHTDFVFSVFNEEHGFVGAIFLLLVYLIFLSRFVWIATSTPKMFDSLVTVGLMSIFFVHIFVNMGMVMGLMPIVGLPLPFMSYGGSSLLTFGLCIGIVTSISIHKNTYT